MDRPHHRPSRHEGGSGLLGRIFGTLAALVTGSLALVGLFVLAVIVLIVVLV